MLTAVPPSTREFLLPMAFSSREVRGKSILASWFSSLEFPTYGCSATIPSQNLAGAEETPSNTFTMMGLSLPFPILFHFPFCFPIPFSSASNPLGPLTNHETQIPGSLSLFYYFQSHMLPFPSGEDFDLVPKFLPADRRTLLLLKDRALVPLMPWGNAGRAAPKHLEYWGAGVLLLHGMTLEALDSL